MNDKLVSVEWKKKKFLDNGFPLAILNTRNKEVWNKL